MEAHGKRVDLRPTPDVGPVRGSPVKGYGSPG